MTSTDMPHRRAEGIQLIRRRLHHIVEAGIAHKPIQRAYDAFIMGLIFANVCAVALETVEGLAHAYGASSTGLKFFRLRSLPSNTSFASGSLSRIRADATAIPCGAASSTC